MIDSISKTDLTHKKIAILILSYNHPEHTSQCVESVKKTMLSLNLQLPIFLLHNGSEPKHIENLKSTLAVEHLYLSKNRGYSGGVNFGLKTLFENFERVLFITNDCKLTHLDFKDVQSLPEGLYAPLINIRETNKIDSMGGVFIPHLAKLNHIYKTEHSNPKYFYVPGSAFLIDREIFLKTGDFNENLGTYWEDVDFSTRTRKLNLNVDFTSAIILNHKIGKTCRKDPYYTNFLYYRNQAIVSRSHTPYYLRPILELVIAKNLLTQTYRLLKSKRLDDLKLLKNAWQEIYFR